MKQKDGLTVTSADKTASNSFPDHFGESVEQCIHCKNYNDYIKECGFNMIPYYIGSFTFLLITGLMGRTEYARYWRYLSLYGLLIFDSYYTFTNNQPPLWLFTSKTVHEKIEFLHEAYILFFVAFSQIAPLLFAEKSDNKALDDVLIDLDLLTKALQKDSLKTFTSVIEPFDKEEDLRLLERRMQKTAIEAQLFMEDELRSGYLNVQSKVKKGK